MNHVLSIISTALVFGMVPPATLFPIFYGSWFPWWESILGRALFTKAIGLALLIDVAVLYALLGDDYPLREYVRLLIFSLIFTGLWYQLYSIIQIKRGKDVLGAKKVLDDANEEKEGKEGVRSSKDA